MKDELIELHNHCVMCMKTIAAAEFGRCFNAKL